MHDCAEKTISSWREPLDVAREVVTSFLVFLSAVLFFAGFLHHYYYLHILGLPISGVALPWQYTIAFAYPVLARIWWELLALVLVSWSVVALVGIWLRKVPYGTSWSGPAGVLAVLFVMFGTLAVAFPSVKRAALDVARSEVTEACKGHVPTLARIGLRAEYLGELKRTYGRDLDEFLSATSVVRYGARPVTVFPNPGGVHAEIVAEDDQEYDVVITGVKAECGNLTVYRIPKSGVSFVRSYVSAP